MRQFELVERVLSYNPQADEAMLDRAYVYAMQKHGEQKRESGDPYFNHPLEVAAILTELKLDDASIVAGLLHDTIEDTDATRAEIDHLFGPEIGAVVDGLTKIERLQLVTREEARVENLRKLLLAISADVRVLLVKLADRLHNMRTLHFVPAEKRARVARETMDIYAPLAERIGMQDMRGELENLAFATLQPQHYQEITDRLAALQGELSQTIADIENELTARLGTEGIKAAVSSRVKSAWSIASKIERKKVALEQLTDMIGFRIVVPTVAECYRALGIVHTCWKVVPGRFKDYISLPKSNDYRSIHTTIVGLEHRRVELQIRTEAMHRTAEFGIAAHSVYKEGIVSRDAAQSQSESQAIAWLRQTIERLTSGASSEDLLEYTKLELFQDQVLCFTPRGRLIALPRGATPIDFAYALHTEIGDTTVGAKINGVLMPIVTRLRPGDEVEIIRDQNHQPPANWEQIAATARARVAIRRAVRQAQNQRAYALGAHVLAGIGEREGLSLDEAESERLAKALGQASRRDLLVAVGEGKVRDEALQQALAEVKGVAKQARPLDLPTTDMADGWFALRDTDLFRFHVPAGQEGRPAARQALAQLNFSTKVHVSPQGVVAGDRVVGIVRPGQPIVVYPIDSEALAPFHDSDVAWLDVRWDLAKGETRSYRVAVSMLVANRTGMLAKVVGAIAAVDANIRNLVMRIVSPDFHRNVFELEMREVRQLNDLFAALNLIAGLSQIRRATVAEAHWVAADDWGGAPDQTGNRVGER